MRGDVLLVKGRARPASGGHVFGQQVGDAVRAETPTARIRKQDLSVEPRRLTHPYLQHRYSGLGKGRASLFAAFA